MIWRILTSNNSILITMKGEQLDYSCDANSTMFSQLYHRLLRFIPNWKAQWHDTNSVD